MKTKPLGALKAAREEIRQLTEERDKALATVKRAQYHILNYHGAKIVQELVRKELDIQNSTAGNEMGFVEGFDRAVRIKEMEEVLITLWGHL